jgi:hypothetical protein
VQVEEEEEEEEEVVEVARPASPFAALFGGQKVRALCGSPWVVSIRTTLMS